MAKAEVLQSIPASMQELVERTARQFGSKERTDDGHGAYKISDAVSKITKGLGLQPVDLLNLVWRMTTLSGEELSELRKGVGFHPIFMDYEDEKRVAQRIFSRDIIEAELRKAHPELIEEEARKIADYRPPRLSDIDGHY